MKNPLRLALILPLLLSACGTTPGTLAAQACSKAIDEKLAGKSYELDLSDMASKFKAGDGSTGEIVTSVLLDKGMSSESKQGCTCRVQFDPNNAAAEPSVIGLIFVW
jgi:hypothetical protein